MDEIDVPAAVATTTFVALVLAARAGATHGDRDRDLNRPPLWRRTGSQAAAVWLWLTVATGATCLPARPSEEGTAR